MGYIDRVQLLLFEDLSNIPGNMTYSYLLYLETSSRH